MNLDDSSESNGRFRWLLQRALRGDQDAAWQLLDSYGNQLLHMLLVRRREGGEARGDASRLVAQIWELLRHDPPGETARGLALPSTELTAPSQVDLPTVSVAASDVATLNPTAPAAPIPTPDEQAELARQRWRHLLVTPEVHAEILDRRLHGDSIVEIAAALGLAESVVRHVLQHQARHEGPNR